MSENLDFPCSQTFRRGLSEGWSAEEEAAYRASFSPVMRMTDAEFEAQLDEWWRNPPDAPPALPTPRLPTFENMRSPPALPLTPPPFRGVRVPRRE